MRRNNTTGVDWTDPEQVKAWKREYDKHYRAAHPEKARARRERFVATPKGRQTTKDSHRRWALRVRREALIAYSQDPPACICCGETHLHFLTLDHAYGSGRAQRKPVGDGTTFFQRLKKMGYPQDAGLRVLCYNCNCGRARTGGVCPHKRD